MMPRRRTILRLGLFLLLGAAVNVAVAWGCALWSTNTADADHQIEIRQDDPGDLARLLASGWKPTPASAHASYPVFAFSLSRRGRTATEIVELSIPDDTHERGGLISSTSENRAAARHMVVGWPLVCLAGMEWNEASLGAPEMWRSRGVIPHSSFDQMTMCVERLVPYEPLLPSFAINTLFYAATLWACWLLFAAPFALRRRRRVARGLCQACSYPVGVSAVCTECGRAVMPHVPTLVRTGRGEP